MNVNKWIVLIQIKKKFELTYEMYIFLEII
jgi:hypothetical protein